jgi:hypothetical protein
MPFHEGERKEFNLKPYADPTLEKFLFPTTKLDCPTREIFIRILVRHEVLQNPFSIYIKRRAI